MSLPFAQPTIGPDEIAEVTACLESGWLTSGPRVKAFEQQLQDYFSAPQALTLSSATAALHLSLLALQLRPGDEVITTPLTYVATINTIVQAGAKPVLVDIHKSTFNINAAKIEPVINERTRAIIPVHFAGLPVDLDPIYALAKKYNLRVIEDAAQAIGTEYKNQLIGSFGDTQVFSFHPNKTITTGEGGCLLTRDAAMAASVHCNRFHGVVRTEDPNHPHYDFDVVSAGFKYNMMDIQAALGIHQLKRLSSFIAHRAQLANGYLAVLKDWPEFSLPKAPRYAHKHSWHLFTPLLNIDKMGMTRQQFISAMAECGINIGVHYARPVHLYSFYRKRFGFKKGDFPIAEAVASRIVSLPLFAHMTNTQQDLVIEGMIKVLRTK